MYHQKTTDGSSKKGSYHPVAKPNKNKDLYLSNENLQNQHQNVEARRQLISNDPMSITKQTTAKEKRPRSQTCLRRRTYRTTPTNQQYRSTRTNNSLAKACLGTHPPIEKNRNLASETQATTQMRNYQKDTSTSQSGLLGSSQY